MTADLARRITAAMDQAQKAAELAKWPYGTDKREGPPWGGDHEWSRALSTDEGPHIAFWSPDRVLATIAADRNLLGYATELAHSGEPNAVVIADGLVKYLAARWVSS
jgi:hypothetical protein